MISPQIFQPFLDKVFVRFCGKPLNFLEDENDNISDWKKLDLPAPAFMKQAHGDSVQRVDVSGKNENTDALITTEKNLPLLVKVADCMAALMYDPKTEVIAAVHAGWRGLAQKIFTKTIGVLQKRYFVHPHNIVLALSPSIHLPEFTNPQKETPEFFHPFIHQKNQIDLWQIAKKELLENGVAASNIEMPAFCTHSDSQQRFWSHRNGDSKRNGSIISLI